MCEWCPRRVVVGYMTSTDTIYVKSVRVTQLYHSLTIRKANPRTLSIIDEKVSSVSQGTSTP